MNTWATHAFGERGNEIGDPYGVPAGVVPRVKVDIALPKAYTPTRAGDPLAQAVDDYLLMERKARAWEKLAVWAHMNDRELFDRMDDLVHPAQEPSTR